MKRMTEFIEVAVDAVERNDAELSLHLLRAFVIAAAPPMVIAMLMPEEAAYLETLGRVREVMHAPALVGDDQL